MLKKQISAILFGLGCFFLVAGGQAEIPEQPEGLVSDFAQIINETVKAELVGLIAGVEKNTGAEIAVVTVSSLDGMSVEEYAVKLFNQWGIGKKGQDNGVLLLVAPNDRKVKIEVGYGLEGVINDGKAGRILDEAVVPFFKANDYSQGILHGCEQIAGAITGQEVEAPSLPLFSSSNGPDVGMGEKIMIMLFFGLFITLGALAVGMGLRGDKFMLIWGTGFGGIPLAMSFAFGYAMGFPLYVLPSWGGMMLVVGVLTAKKLKKAMASSGGSGGSHHSSHWGSGSSFSGGFSSGSSSSSFGGGSSGGGGSSRSW